MFKVLLLLLLFPFFLFGTDFVQCKHLLNRTSFSLDKTQLSACLKSKDYASAVNTLVYRPRALKQGSLPQCARQIIKPRKRMRELTIPERKAFRKKKHESHIALKKYWMEQMLKTDDPFLEKMVLFWHNHFTSSLKKVGQASLLCQQNQLFRAYAFGNFADLLHAIVEDPAMLIYLDNRGNRKGHPNENLARELLELFTLGEGNYSEDDIKALARALTGYSVDKNFHFLFRKRIHDHGQKVFLGKAGDFSAHDIIDIILEQKTTSLFIVKKLWHAFIDDAPNTEEVERLAEIFRENHYELKPLMQALLTSAYFTDPGRRGTMTKSPVELIVGTLRSFDYVNFDSRAAIQFSRRLGQDLFDPPNVKGWSGGKNWISTNTLLIRKGLLNRLTRGDAMKDLKYDLFIPLKEGESREERTAEILLPVKVFLTPAPKFNQTLRTVLQHPLYQLK